MTKASVIILVYLAVCASCLGMNHRNSSHVKRKIESDDDYDWFDLFFGWFYYDDDANDYEFDDKNVTIHCKKCNLSINGTLLNGDKPSGGGMEKTKKPTKNKPTATEINKTTKSDKSSSIPPKGQPQSSTEVTKKKSKETTKTVDAKPQASTTGGSKETTSASKTTEKPATTTKS